MQLAVNIRGVDDEIDAGRAVQLADDDALGAVDDELAAADHDRHVAQVNFFLDRLILDEAQPDAEGPAVGQPQLPTFVGAVARLAQFVFEILQGDCLVVALDGEDFAQHAFQAGGRALFGRRTQLEEAVIRFGLNFGQRRRLDGVAEAAEVADIFRHDGADGGDGHAGCSSQGDVSDAARRGDAQANANGGKQAGVRKTPMRRQAANWSDAERSRERESVADEP